MLLLWFLQHLIKLSMMIGNFQIFKIKIRRCSIIHLYFAIISITAYKLSPLLKCQTLAARTRTTSESTKSSHQLLLHPRRERSTSPTLQAFLNSFPPPPPSSQMIQILIVEFKIWIRTHLTTPKAPMQV